MCPNRTARTLTSACSGRRLALLAAAVEAGVRRRGIGQALPLVVIIFALGVLSVQPATGAPQPGKTYKIGVLHPGSGSDERLAALREAGYVEGQNTIIEPRHAQGRVERLPALARELVGLKPDIILATSNAAIRAAKDATRSIPIVMAYGDDPVASGLVASLARPGGNVTGVTLTAAGTLAAKRMELLKLALPRIRRVALLDWPRADRTSSTPQVEEALLAARSLTLETVLVEVREGS